MLVFTWWVSMVKPVQTTRMLGRLALVITVQWNYVLNWIILQNVYCFWQLLHSAHCYCKLLQLLSLLSVVNICLIVNHWCDFIHWLLLWSRGYNCQGYSVQRGWGKLNRIELLQSLHTQYHRIVPESYCSPRIYICIGSSYMGGMHSSSSHLKFHDHLIISHIIISEVCLKCNHSHCCFLHLFFCVMNDYLALTFQVCSPTVWPLYQGFFLAKMLACLQPVWCVNAHVSCPAKLLFSSAHIIAGKLGSTVLLLLIEMIAKTLNRI